MGSIPGLRKSPGEWKSNSLQDSDLENSMDCVSHGVTKSWTLLRDFHLRQKLVSNKYDLILIITVQVWEFADGLLIFR